MAVDESTHLLKVHPASNEQKGTPSYGAPSIQVNGGGDRDTPVYVEDAPKIFFMKGISTKETRVRNFYNGGE